MLVFFYLYLPVYLGFVFFRQFIRFTALFYPACALIIFYLLNKYSREKSRLDYQAAGLQEKINLLRDENAGAAQNQASLKAKIARYNGFKKIIEELSESLDSDVVAARLCRIAHTALGQGKGTCLLYLVDAATQKLFLFKTAKEDPEQVIKAKEGDIFDFWLMRQSVPLLIEDIKRDFRFDPERLKPEHSRAISSLIASPFISERRFLGILRLDCPRPNRYTQDDLRFLVTLCDLGAVALENSELFQKMRDLAIHDGLTALYTKDYFLERVKEECARAPRAKRVFSLVMLDIDFFKQYNDKFGHAAGDIVLKKIARNMLEYLKDSNALVCRFGGEEFCLFLPGADKKKAAAISEGLRSNIEKEKIILRRQETAVTVSAGVAAFPADASAETELIQKADQAMYAAKEKGRNRVCCI